MHTHNIQMLMYYHSNFDLPTYSLSLVQVRVRPTLCIFVSNIVQSKTGIDSLHWYRISSCFMAVTFYDVTIRHINFRELIGFIP